MGGHHTKAEKNPNLDETISESDLVVLFHFPEEIAENVQRLRDKIGAKLDLKPVTNMIGGIANLGPYLPTPEGIKNFVTIDDDFPAPKFNFVILGADPDISGVVLNLKINEACRDKYMAFQTALHRWGGGVVSVDFTKPKYFHIKFPIFNNEEVNALRLHEKADLLSPEEFTRSTLVPRIRTTLTDPSFGLLSRLIIHPEFLVLQNKQSRFFYFLSKS